MTLEEISQITAEEECPGVRGIRALPIHQIGDWVQHMHIYQPEQAPTEPRPALMMIHGGGFTSGHPRGNALLARNIALELGMTTFAPNYRLGTREAPSFPAPLEDNVFAWNWIRDNAAEWNVDTSKMFVGGDSAGGTLSALALTRGLLPGCQGLVEHWGPLDFITRWFDNGEQQGAEVNLLQGNYPENPVQYHQASALTHVKPGLPPALFIYGGQDPIVHKRQGQLGHAAWQSVGSASEYVVFDNIGHGTVGDNRGQLIKVAQKDTDFLRSLI